MLSIPLRKLCNYLPTAISVATTVYALKSIVTVLMLLAATDLNVLRKGCVTSETGFEAGSIRLGSPWVFFFFFFFSISKTWKDLLLLLIFLFFSLTLLSYLTLRSK